MTTVAKQFGDAVQNGDMVGLAELVGKTLRDGIRRRRWVEKQLATSDITLTIDNEDMLCVTTYWPTTGGVQYSRIRDQQSTGLRMHNDGKHALVAGEWRRIA